MCKMLLIVGLLVAAEATAARFTAAQRVEKNRPVTKVRDPDFLKVCTDVIELHENPALAKLC